MTPPEIIVALDYSTHQAALKMASQLNPAHCKLKVGKELFTRSGPDIIKALHQQGFDVFLDLKYHDIPTTVAKACFAAAELGVWMMNVHVLGGEKMMRAAKEAIVSSGHDSLLIGVTLLTSMDQSTFEQLGFRGSLSDKVQHLATMAADCELDGVVCSAHEAAVLKRRIPKPGFHLVTPGIRLSADSHDDQHRIMTPLQAKQAGSDYLVIGRPITAAADPLQAIAAIRRGLS